jgi:uncharacterized protein (UPF0332 family)
MNEYDLNKLINSPTLVDRNINKQTEKGLLLKHNKDLKEIEGHILKAEHNIRFVNKIFKLNFSDWAITGCYYASYHAALALIMTKGYSSKNHLATLCVLIKEFYNKGLTREDIEILVNLLDYQDILFYVESKKKREGAAYSTKTSFNNKDVEQLRMKAVLFVSKIKEMIEN